MYLQRCDKNIKYILFGTNAAANLKELSKLNFKKKLFIIFYVMLSIVTT